MTEEKAGACSGCGKECRSYMNYCSWECHVETLRAAGAVERRPNGLPVRCVMADGTLLEVSHGDHPDYKFPVDVEYVGPADPARDDYTAVTGDPAPSDEAARAIWGETHALIYTDGCVAVTLYEHSYDMWLVRDGSPAASRMRRDPKAWRLTEASLEKIRALRTRV